MRRLLPSLAFAVTGALAPFTCLCAAHATTAAASTVTVPMQVELNRPYIDVTVTGPDGQHATAHAFVDTGGGGLLFSAGLARRLGLKATGEPEHDDGATLAPTSVPALGIGGKPLELADAHAFIVADAPGTLHHTDAEMMLPGRFLRKYVVVLDYPAHAFTLADPAHFRPDGTDVQAVFGGGMPVVHVSVAGESHGFLMDTGGQYCMVSIADLDAWKKRHPAWPHVAGAWGPANMLLGNAETKLSMLRIGTLQWGPFRIGNAGAVSRGVGNYERFMSGVVGMPVIGSIGGNVLRHFKVTVDYPAGKVYLAGPASVRDAPLDMAGIMLEPAARGGYEVAAVATGVKGIAPGERLLEVDGHDVTRMPFARVAGLLGGAVGTRHALVLERGGARATVEASVQTIF